MQAISSSFLSHGLLLQASTPHAAKNSFFLHFGGGGGDGGQPHVFPGPELAVALELELELALAVPEPDFALELDVALEVALALEPEPEAPAIAAMEITPRTTMTNDINLFWNNISYQSNFTFE